MRNLSPLTVVVGVAVFAAGCSQKTIYSEMYSPKRNRFVATVERPVATELPPETVTQETIVPQNVVVPMPGFDGGVPAVPEPAAPPVIPGLEGVPADAAPAPMDAAPMDAAPPAMDAAPVM